MTPAQTDISRALDAATSLLYAVGRAHPDHNDPEIQVHCLLAADLLQAAGAHRSGLHVGPNELDAAIRAALGELASLPLDEYQNEIILDASEAAHVALERLEDT